MAKEGNEKTKVKAKEAISLPGYTSIENMLDLLDALRRKNNDENAAKQVFAMGSATYTHTKSALRNFNLIDDDCGFLPLGRDIAFSNEDEKKQHILPLIVEYTPYETLLIKLFLKGTVATETTIEEVINFWGRFNNGSSQRNMKEAATLFMTIMEYLGFGKYTKGRNDKPTRFVWTEDAKHRIESALETAKPADPPKPEEPTKPDEPTKPEEPTDSDADSTKDKVNGEKPQTLDAEIIGESKCKPTDNYTPPFTTNSSMIPNITINVDMSAWPEEKIKKFFKYAYGQFEEEQE